MSAVTISNITATPWSFYDTNTNPYTDTIYTMLNQYSIASTNIQGSSAALQATTGYINTNNEQLAMLNEPWTDQSLFPWPTDAGSAFMATQNELVGNGILPDYQYTLASTPELVISPAATSYSQAATNLSTTSTPLVDPGAGVNSMQIPSDAMLPGSGGPNTVGIALSAAPPGTAVIVGSSTFLVASTSVGTELVRASSATLYTGSFDQYLYTLPSNYTLPSPAPSTYAFASSTTLLAPFYESGNTQFYAAPPITNTQLAALSDSTLPGATNPVTPIVLTSAVSTQLGLTGEPPGTAVYVGPQSNNDVYVIAQDSSNPPNTVLVQLTDPLTDAMGFVQNPALSDLQNWNSQYAQASPSVPTWPTGLAPTNLITLALGSSPGGPSNNDNLASSIVAITNGNQATGAIKFSDSYLIGYGLNDVKAPGTPAPNAGNISGTVSSLSSTTYSGDDYFVEGNASNNPAASEDVNDVLWSLQNDSGLSDADTFGNFYNTTNINSAILPTADQANTIVNNMAKLQSEGVVTNSVDPYNALGVATSPASSANSAALAAGATMPSFYAAYTTPDTVDGGGGVAPFGAPIAVGDLVEDQNDIQNNGAALSYTGYPPTNAQQNGGSLAPVQVSPSAYTQLTSTGYSATSSGGVSTATIDGQQFATYSWTQGVGNPIPGITSDGVPNPTIVQNPDGSYGVLVTGSNGNVYEMALTGMTWNPTSAQVTDWTNQLGAATALQKTLSLSQGIPNTTSVTVDSTYYDSMSISYLMQNATAGSQPLTWNVLDANVKTFTTSGSDTLDEISNTLHAGATANPPTYTVPIVVTVTVPFYDNSGAVVKDSNGNEVTASVAASNGNPATGQIVMFPPYGTNNWVAAKTVTPFIGQPSAETIQTLQGDYTTNNSNLSNTGQDEQLVLQTYFAIVSAAAQGLGTVIAAGIAEYGVVDNNI